MAEARTAVVQQGAPSFKDINRETLTAGERIIAKFHPNPMSFVRWYLPSILLLAWTGFFLIIVLLIPAILQGVRNLLGTYSGLAVLVVWVVGAVLIGFILPKNPRTSKQNVTAGTFLRAVRMLYLVLVLLPVILFFLLAARSPGTDYSVLIYLYTLAVSALIVFIYNIYRLSFTYFITNFRVIFRYRFFKTVENNLRFSQIRDVEVNRTLLQRVFKLGNVRPYTGTEENLVDLTPGYDSPDECFFGVRNPEYVKRLILEQMLGPQDHTQDRDARTDSPAARAAAAAGADAERVQRLEKELATLRAQQPGQAPPGVLPPAPAAAPRVVEPAAPPATPAAQPPSPPARGRLAEVTPTSDERPAVREHAQLGDDRDAFHSPEEEFRSGADKPKRPAASGTPADEDNKPRSI